MKARTAVALSLIAAMTPYANAYEVAGVRPGMTPQELKSAGFTDCKASSGSMACTQRKPVAAAIGRLRVLEVLAILAEPYDKVEEVRVATSTDLGPSAPRHCKAKGKGEWADVVPVDCALSRRAEISKVFGQPHPGPWISRYVAGWTDCKTQLAYLRSDGYLLLREAGTMALANCKDAEARAARDAKTADKNDAFIRSMKP